MKHVKYITTKIIGVHAKNMTTNGENWNDGQLTHPLKWGHNDIFTVCSVQHCTAGIVTNLEYIHVLFE